MTRSSPRESATAPKRRGRPTDHSSDETRATILATAQRLFGEAGYKGVSMDRLATEAELTVRAIYHYFPSKRELFRSATDEAFGRFAGEVAEQVFRHDDLRARVHGYLEAYRSLHTTDPHVLSFIGMVLVDALSEDVEAGANGSSATGAHLEGSTEILRVFLERLVDDALARGEVHPDLDRDGALLLLNTLGMGLALATLDEKAGSFPAMLDAFELLVDGSLFADPSTPARVATRRSKK